MLIIVTPDSRGGVQFPMHICHLPNPVLAFLMEKATVEGFLPETGEAVTHTAFNKDILSHSAVLTTACVIEEKIWEGNVRLEQENK